MVRGRPPARRVLHHHGGQSLARQIRKSMLEDLADRVAPARARGNGTSPREKPDSFQPLDQDTPPVSVEQYRLLEPLIPAAEPGVCPWTTDMQRLLAAMYGMVGWTDCCRSRCPHRGHGGLRRHSA
jgi:hypothetical protein